jgi:hypothetical protein
MGCEPAGTAPGRQFQARLEHGDSQLPAGGDQQPVGGDVGQHRPRVVAGDVRRLQLPPSSALTCISRAAAFSAGVVTSAP